MKKFPKIELKALIPAALVISAFGFCLMMTDTLMNLGAILFSLGLLPLAVALAKSQD